MDKRCTIIVINVGKAIGPTIANFTIFMGGIPAINFYGWFTIAFLMLVNMCKYNLSFMVLKLSLDCGHRFREANKN